MGKEGLRREFGMDIIAAYPRVVYEVQQTNGEKVEVDNPAHLPDPSVIDEIREPVVECFVMCPNENIGDMMQLIMEKRGEVQHTEWFYRKRERLTAIMPWNEMLGEFKTRIKALTH